VHAADIAHLPAAARRYLEFMGALGRPRDWSFRVEWEGRFRRGPEEPWRRIQAVQYDSSPEVARVFHMRMSYGPLPVVARDVYVRGKGRMLGRLLELVTVVDGRGDEFDTGELVTYLNDCVLIAPSMLLRSSATFAEVDDASFDVSLTDLGRTVSARVLVDSRGAPVDFSTTDRFLDVGGHSVRTRWTTPVHAWDETGDRPRVARASALWHPPTGAFAYADFTMRPGTLQFGIPPG
jgi:hypothetical protein